MVDTAPRTTYIGASTPKVDGVDKVTGAARYGADMRLPGMLEGRILRSPHAHARIKRIDTSKAEAAPGVMAVVTGKDFPTLKPGSHVQVGVLRLDMYRISHNAIAVKRWCTRGNRSPRLRPRPPRPPRRRLR